MRTVIYARSHTSILCTFFFFLWLLCFGVSGNKYRFAYFVFIIPLLDLGRVPRPFRIGYGRG